MEKSKFGKFIDHSTIFLLSFFIVFVLLKTIIKNNIFCTIISFLLSFFVLIIVIYYENKKYIKLSLKKSEEQKIINCNFALRKLSPASQTTFFKNMLKSEDVAKTTNGLIINNKILLHINLNLDVINKQDIFFIYSKVKNMRNKSIEEICIICNQVSEDVYKIINNFNDILISFFTPIETYSLMKKYSFFPDLPEQQVKIKNNIFKKSLLKSKAKHYIHYGIILFVFSLFVPFTKYYLICASILFLCGIILLCFGKEKTKITPLSKQILLK